jgi:hypothetical protein
MDSARQEEPKRVAYRYVVVKERLAVGKQIFNSRMGLVITQQDSGIDYASISLKNRRLAAPSSSKDPLPSMESPPW